MARTYKTQVQWGGPNAPWHPAADLTVAISEGGKDSVTSKLSWQDEAGNFASISFQSGATSFIGYYQKPGEGPISYMGSQI